MFSFDLRSENSRGKEKCGIRKNEKLKYRFRCGDTCLVTARLRQSSGEGALRLPPILLRSVDTLLGANRTKLLNQHETGIKRRGLPAKIALVLF